MVSNIFYFHPYLGKISNLTNIFQMGWNHQPDHHLRKSLYFFAAIDVAILSLDGSEVEQITANWEASTPLLRYIVTSDDRFPPTGGLVRKIPEKFQRNLGWWNIIPFGQIYKWSNHQLQQQNWTADSWGIWAWWAWATWECLFFSAGRVVALDAGKPHHGPLVGCFGYKSLRRHIHPHLAYIYIYIHMEAMCPLFFLQKKVFSNQNNSHLGYRYI